MKRCETPDHGYGIGPKCPGCHRRFEIIDRGIETRTGNSVDLYSCVCGVEMDSISYSENYGR
jgi:hypothetical protein